MIGSKTLINKPVSKESKSAMDLEFFITLGLGAMPKRR